MKSTYHYKHNIAWLMYKHKNENLLEAQAREKYPETKHLV